MAILNILEFPDKRLRTIAKPVELVDSEIQRLVDDMLETMYEARGVGLAATQVNVHKRVIVMDISDEKNQAIYDKYRDLWYKRLETYYLRHHVWEDDQINTEL